MPIQILMPALSPTMSEGNLARWLKKEGDTVKSGDVLAEIETDKATMEFEAVDEGTLGKILIAAGTQGVKVNEPIALLLEEGEDASALASFTVKSPAASPVPAAPAAATPVAAAASAPVAVPAVAAAGQRIFATPLAKRIAKDAGLDLKAVAGSGPHGRIIRADVDKAIAGGPARAAAPAAASAPKPAAPAPAPAPVPEFGPAYTEVPLSSMRKVIAKRLTEAKQTVPHFYLTVDCQVDKLLALRAELNGRSDDYKLSVNDFVIRAVALALRKVPAANASFTETAIRLYSDVDISVAVATPNGLITPIIKHADQKGLAGISNEMKVLAVKARDGKLKPEEFQGGGFTISNLGMFGVKDFAAIINPPQGCILAVGAGEQRPVVKDGALAIATVMSCTLSVDHRVVDGAVGAEFLAAFKKLIEEPLTMLL
ncbi:pyruvate dehydrogenase complex dihydrolipoamide acetyltransferase [Telmatospirillum siberiense]|uniref:Acetyltransferase component of pyruvate dehydrogenase complex n=1 Tax=Telmatospirillum siberiense TaxID=382514 RepID=A0A2N3PZ88_9PROT|nr:pyruvate dehydrogenase complex dihydrolipoamide acetyltransferase [Telmatospirillum siberiense]PKU25708.1 pyruvate dehydrogenase complex dihydrolipoamide acetyltransferase [Telmatospirillum siberiense]